MAKKTSKKQMRKSNPRKLSSNEHKGRKRRNNPTSGQISQKTEPLRKIETKMYEYDKHLSPSLNWTGKKEGYSFKIPIVSLHTHEKIEPKEIVKDFFVTKTPSPQLSLFSDELNRPKDKAIEFYQHENKWSNRLIAGDSLLVMNSLIAKENMAGKVQCVYIDPPYGIKYKSNFQPFTNKSHVHDSDKDQDLTAEPEMLKAFRDTWQLGIHSYLSYLRDRILLSKDLLKDTGSLFIQISDENLHYVRSICDEIFGNDRFIVSFPMKKKGSQKSSLISPVNDYLVWYTKSPKWDKKNIKYHKLFTKRPLSSENLEGFKSVEIDGKDIDIKNLNDPHGNPFNYLSNFDKILQDYPNAKFFRGDPLQSGGIRKNQSRPFEFRGKTFAPKKGCCWKTTTIDQENKPAGMKLLAKHNRFVIKGNNLYYRRYFKDFEYKELSNWWDGLGGASGQIYVVQTNQEILKRCILMTTDPGDIVFDPTCGSGTTACVAEQWGRRWITCDTSRVAIALAKQRLLTASFDYYKLENEREGVSSGFQYERTPRITLKSIANNKPPEEEVLYDRPIKDGKKVRVSSPFTVEAVPSQTVESMEQEKPFNYRDEWLEEVKRTGIRGKRGVTADMEFARLDGMKGTEYLHAEGVTTNPRNIILSFGTEHAPLDKRQVESALKEVGELSKGNQPDILIFAAFQFDPEASRLIGESNKGKIKVAEVQMNMDLQTYDLKKSTSGESFWLLGQPDVSFTMNKKGECTVTIRGWDYYNPASGKIESGGSDRVSMWALDPNYNGRAIYPKQVFFPMGGANDGWNKLTKSLKAEIDEEKIQKFKGITSLPFKVGENGKVAVKIIDDRGVESLWVKRATKRDFEKPKI